MFEKRLRYVALGGAVFFVVLLVRLFEMQVIHAQEWREKAAELGRRHLVLPGRRGTIRDRNGTVLAEDRLHFDLMVNLDRYRLHPWVCSACGRPVATRGESPPRKCSACEGREFGPGTAADWSALPGLLKMDTASAHALLDKAWERYRTVVDAVVHNGKGARYGVSRPRDAEKVLLRRNWLLCPDAPREAVREITLHPDRYRGLDVRPASRRWSIEDEALGPFVGIVSVAYLEETERLEKAGYGVQEINRLKLGRTGLERAFQDALGGREGWREVDRDQRGRVKEVLAERLPVDGRDVTTSIDSRLQVLMTKVLREESKRHGAIGGAFVAVDPGTGEILVLASHAVDPESKHNFAVSATMPGSVFKVVTALAGLEGGTLDVGKTFECRGIWKDIRCTHAHGELNVVEAICGSCNPFFAWAADPREGTGIEILNYWADQLGFGKKSGIGLPREQPGVLATPEWRQRQYELHPKYWLTPELQTGEIRQVGFGKGPISVTPLQVARTMAIVANGGFEVPLTLEMGGGGMRGRIFSARSVGPVREGMAAVVSRGTGRRTGLSRWNAAGKTGTAEIKRGEARHMAWFAGYAPADKPRVAFACYLRETPAHGADAAGPVVARFLAEYLKP